MKIFGTDNLEYQVYDRYTAALNPLMKNFLKVEVRRMRRFEESLYRSADINLAVAESEQEQIEKITSKEAYLVPNGVDVARFNLKKTPSEIPTLLYIGSSRYFQNRQAIQTILEKIYPFIKSKVNLLIVSYGVSGYIRDLVKIYPSVTLLENLMDVTEA